jgi:hypothetical protein
LAPGRSARRPPLPPAPQVAGSLTATRVHRRAFGASEWGSLARQLTALAGSLSDISERLGAMQQQQHPQQHHGAGCAPAAAAKPVRA